ncbi:hypothetical protein A2704_07185 [Candidatus Kaiserbacteria bacterium RIFCSPHIGHO2_01_FULL_54_36b]|uniref:Glycosyl transferase family 1 n=1 Tax=Candidatus Kaiserbacteria bacterium RIFCSPHIGHO2_01_FULL_54_36b TaxID=1798483 RepID=A0A1F6CKR5_9BACT|nr:MAG: hypothetical protein A2704_07185 [Candidatus Kaiserbacteria bacterium RIFCSPHIGHO2_01_FULL_54_36b]
MRIALFTDTFPPEVNGVANSVVHIARSLSARGHTVRVYTVSKVSAQELERTTGDIFSVKVLPSVGLPIYLGVRVTAPLGLALSDIREFKPDIIHSHTPFSVGREAIIAARKLRVPLIGTHHTFFNHYLKHVHLDYQWAQRLSWSLTVGYYNHCDVVISPTRSLAEELRVHGLKKRCEIVVNAIDTESFRPPESSTAKEDLKKKLGISERSLVYMGRVSYEKSIDQLLKALVLLVPQMPDIKLVIVGDGPERAKLGNLAKSLGIEQNVHFSGFLFDERLTEVLQTSDLFVTASKSENMPLAVLEAMACGLPVVTVTSLGLSEIVQDESNGYLLPPDDPQRMTKAILHLLQDKTMHQRFSEKSREISLNYSDDAVMARLEGVYMSTKR